MKEKFLYAFKNTASMDEVTLQDSELYNYEADDLKFVKIFVFFFFLFSVFLFKLK